MVFPNNTMATNISGAQITIPSGAIIHQRQTEGMYSILSCDNYYIFDIVYSQVLLFQL